jgi:CBS domain-containing protein
MTPSMMTEDTAAEAMQPLPATIRLDSTAAEARARMREEDLSFLVVVAPDTDKLLGVVLLGALERACEANGHDPESCHLVQHLKTDIDFCFVEERVAEAVGPEPDVASLETLAGRKARVRRSLPVVVVDEQKVPVGYLER